jgi:hypothetical protein
MAANAPFELHDLTRRRRRIRIASFSRRGFSRLILLIRRELEEGDQLGPGEVNGVRNLRPAQVLLLRLAPERCRALAGNAGGFLHGDGVGSKRVVAPRCDEGAPFGKTTVSGQPIEPQTPETSAKWMT